MPFRCQARSSCSVDFHGQRGGPIRYHVDPGRAMDRIFNSLTSSRNTTERILLTLHWVFSMLQLRNLLRAHARPSYLRIGARQAHLAPPTVRHVRFKRPWLRCVNQSFYSGLYGKSSVLLTLTSSGPSLPKSFSMEPPFTCGATLY